VAFLPAGLGSDMVSENSLAEGRSVGLHQIQVKRSGKEFTYPAATAG